MDELLPKCVSVEPHLCVTSTPGAITHRGPYAGADVNDFKIESMPVSSNGTSNAELNVWFA